MNPLPQFFHLLGEAPESQEAVDRFDLVSGNPESERIWADLNTFQRNDALALIAYVVEHHAALLKAFAAAD